MRYVATFEHEEAGGFSVVFPDLPGCQTCGETLEEAKAMAADALEGWLAVTLEAGEAPPRPQAVDGIAIKVPSELHARLRACWSTVKL